MKHLLGALVLLAATAGCVTNHQDIIKSAPAQPAPPPPPPVTDGQVNNQNAHAVSQALWDEMDRDSQNQQLDQPKATTSPMKK
jgi:hypothetical protein